MGLVTVDAMVDEIRCIVPSGVEFATEENRPATFPLEEFPTYPGCPGKEAVKWVW